MGYRFSVEHASLLANLINGNVERIVQIVCEDKEEKKLFYDLIYDLKHSIISTNPINFSELCEFILNKMNEIDNLVKIGRKKQKFERITKKNFTEISLYGIVKLLSDRLNRFDFKFLFLTKDLDFKVDLESIVSEYDFNFSGLFLVPLESVYEKKPLINAFPHIERAIINSDDWPVVVVWRHTRKAYIVKIDSMDDVHNMLEMIHERGEDGLLDLDQSNKKESANFIFHLSDLHIGKKGIQKNVNRLKSLYRRDIRNIRKSYSKVKIYFIITGDLIDSPSEEAIDHLKGLLDDFRNDSKNKPIVVLGNHDINSHGIASNTSLKKSIAQLFDMQNTNLIHQRDDLIFLSFNSNTDGYIAQGKIGESQLIQCNDELDGLTLEDQVTIALLHHHIIKVQHPKWLKKNLFEKLFPKPVENALTLIDADIFKEWINTRKIDLILHGHKHIPFYDDKTLINSIIIGCGSSTGNVKHIDSSKTYLSYNILKITKNEIVINQIVEEDICLGTKTFLQHSVSRHK